MTIDQIESATRELTSLCQVYGIEFINCITIDVRGYNVLLRYDDFQRIFADHPIAVETKRFDDGAAEFSSLTINGITFTCNRSLPTHSPETDFLAELVSCQ